MRAGPHAYGMGFPQNVCGIVEDGTQCSMPRPRAHKRHAGKHQRTHLHPTKSHRCHSCFSYAFDQPCQRKQSQTKSSIRKHTEHDPTLLAVNVAQKLHRQISQGSTKSRTLAIYNHLPTHLQNFQRSHTQAAHTQASQKAPTFQDALVWGSQKKVLPEE